MVLGSASVDNLHNRLHRFYCGGCLRKHVAPNFFESEGANRKDEFGDLIRCSRDWLFHVATLGAKTFRNNGVQIEGPSQGRRVAALGLARRLQ